MNAELIVQVVTILVVIYAGWHLRSQLRTLKEAVASQKVTIEAQVKHREDFEALNRNMKQTLDTMQQVIAFFDPQAQLQRDQARQALIERDHAARVKEMARQVDEMHTRLLAHISEIYSERSSAGYGLFVNAMWFLDLSVRRRSSTGPILMRTPRQPSTRSPPHWENTTTPILHSGHCSAPSRIREETRSVDNL
jgi:hypothetical protein